MVESPSCLAWRKDTYSIVFMVRSAHTASICSLARDGRTMPSASSKVAVVEAQRPSNRRPPWAAVAQGGVALRMHISIVFTVRLAHTASECSLAFDGRTMPSVSSTVAVVKSQQ